MMAEVAEDQGGLKVRHKTARALAEAFALLYGKSFTRVILAFEAGVEQP